MNLFRFVARESRIVFNHDEYGYIKEFTELLKHNRKPSKGDFRGDKKLIANAELGVIWWCNDVRSPGIKLGLTGDDLLKDAKRNFKLNDDWQPSKRFRDAEEAFKRYNRSVVKDTFKELLKSFNIMGNYISIIRKQFEKKLSNNDELDNESLQLLSGLFKELMNLGSDLPKRIEALKQAENLLIKEEKVDMELGRSGNPVPDSADPNKALS